MSLLLLELPELSAEREVGFVKLLLLLRPLFIKLIGVGVLGDNLELESRAGGLFGCDFRFKWIGDLGEDLKLGDSGCG